MLLRSVRVGPFKSINEPQSVAIEAGVTVLVGMNEAGKTVFLQALTKSRDALGIARFDPVEDYPRKDLTPYLKAHDTKAADAVSLTYVLSDDEVEEANKALGTRLPKGFSFSTTHDYRNECTIALSVDEAPTLKGLLSGADLSSEAKAAVKGVSNLRTFAESLKGASLTDADKELLKAVEARIARADKTKTPWSSVVQWEVWQWLSPRIPRFLYFGEYEVLHSKINLSDLAARVEAAKNDPKQLGPEYRGALALLRMADISVDDFAKPGGYEPLKAKIEAVSINLTDQIMQFWKQNEDLEVEVDIKPDAADVPPFNSGPNLYLRIKNRRHRGVSTPFRQRSRGFIWFFSFLVWFDSVQHQLDAQHAGRNLILLLDEPGLSLHALAQQDLLRYVDDLANRHQVVYTTHSPFMVHADRLHQVRTVEDLDKVGTVITSDVSSSGPRTIFPLQAALGYTIAQNLFISERNVVVEGPSELVYLRVVSSVLESLQRTGCRSDVTLVPAGGLDKVATFVALLGGSGLKLAILHDYKGAPDQHLADLVRRKMISRKSVLDASQFRDLSAIGTSGKPTDIEDLFTPKTYLETFNGAFKAQLGAASIKETDLPPGERIVARLESYLQSKAIQLRPSGGFNHYSVASYFARQQPTLDADTLARFESLFKAINALF